MHHIIWYIVVFPLFAFFYVVVPALTIWGWVRWVRSQHVRDFGSITSLIAFALATASALLAAGSIVWAHIAPFPYDDLRLLGIYRWGLLLSAGALLFSLGGLWKSNPLRWHALVCGVGNVLFWVVSVAGE